MNNYIFSACLFFAVAFISISARGINSNWVSSWRTDSYKSQSNESQAKVTGGYPSKGSENFKQNGIVVKVENTPEFPEISCFVTRSDTTVLEKCPGSCYSIEHQHFAIVGCSTTKHPTGTEVVEEFVWKYYNTDLCNVFE